MIPVKSVKNTIKWPNDHDLAVSKTCRSESGLKAVDSAATRVFYGDGARLMHEGEDQVEDRSLQATMIVPPAELPQ